MTYIKTLFLTLLLYAASEFLAGLFGVDSTKILAGTAMFLACRSDLRIDELEKEKQNDLALSTNEAHRA